MNDRCLYPRRNRGKYDEQVFRNVYIDYGVVVWEDGNIDLSPELLYRDGVPAEDTAIA